jgi:P4 family phage/plasmid primase-like protien
MAQTTADAVLDALQSYGLKQEGLNKYRCNSPFRTNSDSCALRLTIDADGEHGAWYDHVTGESGSLYDLATQLGVDLPAKSASTLGSKRPYTGLADYADEHGVPTDVLTDWGWKEGQFFCPKHGRNRPALLIPTATGTRARFTDGLKPPYMHERGYKRCWYGFESALKVAYETKQPLVISNGEISTTAAQYHGVAAIAVTGGGENGIPPQLLQQLQTVYTGQVLIALDCDEAGQRGAQKMLTQLQAAGFEARAVDLNGGKGFDLADFARLHQWETVAALHALHDLEERATPAHTQPTGNAKQSSRKPDAEDAAVVLADQHHDTLAYDEEIQAYRKYQDEAWQVVPNRAITLDALVIKALTQQGVPRTETHVNAVLRFARRHLNRMFDRASANKKLIAFANGTLEMTMASDGSYGFERVLLRQHNADDNVTYCLPYPWQPGLPTPLIDRLLESITPDLVARAALRVHIGLALLGDTSLHNVLLLLGQPGCGKTTLLRLWNLMLGQEPDQFAPGTIFENSREGSLQRTVCRTWHGVALDEFPTDALQDEEPFKKMTSHSGIDSRAHHRDPINAQWKPKIIMAGNDVPSFKDASGACQRRMLVIECPNTLAPTQVDAHLVQKLQAELGGFVAQCLAAALATLQVGSYPISAAMRATFDMVATEGDPLKAFVAECCLLTIYTGQRHHSYSAKAYQRYTEWCSTNGHRPLSNTMFSKRLRAYAPWRITKKIDLVHNWSASG